MMSTSIFASDMNTINSTDIVWRTINFIVFAVILWYLTANPVKNYLLGRTKKIADNLEKVQGRIAQTKLVKEEAEQDLQKAKELATEILELSKEEIKIIVNSISMQCEIDIKMLDEHNSALMELEKRKMIKNVVTNILSELLREDDLALSKQDMINIILRKVA